MERNTIVKKPILLPELMEIAKKVPCANRVIPLAIAEMEAGNILLALDKVSMLPDETYYICQFKYFSKTRPRGLKKGENKFYECEELCYSNNFGAVEVRFNCDWEIEEED